MKEQGRVFCLSIPDSDGLFASVFKYANLENQYAKYAAEDKERQEHSRNYVFLMEFLSKLQSVKERTSEYDKFILSPIEYFELSMVLYVINQKEELIIPEVRKEQCFSLPVTENTKSDKY